MRNDADPMNRLPHMPRARRLPVPLVCLLLLCALLPATGLADPVTQDGLQAELTTDKAEYAVGETANVKVVVSNTNSDAMTNVQVELDLPANFALASGEPNTTFPTIPGGGASEVFVTATVESDPSAPVENNRNLPLLLLWVGVGLLLAAALVTVLVRRRNRKNKGPGGPGGTKGSGNPKGPGDSRDPRGTIGSRDPRDPRASGTSGNRNTQGTSGALRDTRNPTAPRSSTQTRNPNHQKNTDHPGSPKGPNRTYALLLCLALAASMLVAPASLQAEPVRKTFALSQMVMIDGTGATILAQVSYDWEEAVPVTGVALDQPALTLTQGGATATLAATISPEDATDKGVYWTSSNPQVATVSESGVVTPMGPGTAIITATTADGGKQAASAVTVASASVPVTGISLSPGSLTLAVGGGSGELVATVIPAGATNKGVTWTSSNPNVARVSSGGTVSPVGAGSATITATTADGGKRATSSVTVNSAVVPVTGVSISTNTLRLTQGGAVGTLTATVSPSNATTQRVTWASSNPSVATVSSSGVVSPVGTGSATITATTVDGGRQATCAVTVAAGTVPVTGVSLSQQTLSLVQGGAPGTLTAAVSPSNATNQQVTWASSNTGVATVSGGGVVTPVAAGTTTVTVTTADGGKQAACAVTVRVATIPVTGVALDRTSIDGWDMDSVPTQTLTATVSPPDASNPKVTWKSSDPNVAKVAQGVVTAIAPGSATITVTTDDGGKQASCALTIIRGGKTAANAEAAKVTGFGADGEATNTQTTLGFPVQLSGALAQGATYQFASTSVPLGGGMDAASGLLSLNTQSVVDAADLSTATVTFTVTVNGTASDPVTLPIFTLLGEGTTTARLRTDKATLLTLDQVGIDPVSASARSLPLKARLSSGVVMPPCPASPASQWPAGVTAAELGAATDGNDVGIVTIAITQGALTAGSGGSFVFENIVLTSAGTAYTMTVPLTILVPAVN